MTLVGLLIVVVVACLVIWAAKAIIGAFGIGQPWATLLYVVVVLVVAFWALGQLGVTSGIRL